MEKVVLWAFPLLAVGALIAYVMGLLPPTAVVIVPTIAVVAGAFVAYYTSFRGPRVRVLPMPVNGFRHSLNSGWSANGMPSTWNVSVRLLVTNDSPRTGYLTRFAVDSATVKYIPRKPRAFDVSISPLEYAATQATTLPVSLPVTFPPRASRDDLLFSATLTFTLGPGELADDLRELSAIVVTYRYSGGLATSRKERECTIAVPVDEVRTRVRDFWRETSRAAPWLERLEGNAPAQGPQPRS